MDAYQARSEKSMSGGSAVDSNSSVQIITEQHDMELSPLANCSSRWSRPKNHMFDQDLSRQSPITHSETRLESIVSKVPQRISINQLPRRHKKVSSKDSSSIVELNQRPRSSSKTPADHLLPLAMDKTVGDDQPRDRKARSLHPRVVSQIDGSPSESEGPLQQSPFDGTQVTPMSHSQLSESRSTKRHLAPHLLHLTNTSSAGDQVSETPEPSPKKHHQEVPIYIPPHKQGPKSKTSKENGAECSPRSHLGLPVEEQESNPSRKLSASKSPSNDRSLLTDGEEVSKITATASTANLVPYNTKILRELASLTVDDRALRKAQEEPYSPIQRLDSLQIPAQDTSKLSCSMSMNSSAFGSKDGDGRQTEKTHKGPRKRTNEAPKGVKRFMSTDTFHANDDQGCTPLETETYSIDLPAALSAHKSKGKGKKKDDSPGHNHSKKFQIALPPESWEVRPSFDSSGDLKLAGVKAWTTDQAVNQVTAPAILDTGHPDFLTGVGLVHGDTELQAGIEASLHNTARSSTAASLLKRNQTAQDAIEERLSMQKISGELLESSINGMSKEERRAKRLALLEDINRRNNEPDLPSEHKPEANIYMRPVEKKDARAIAEIYNHYIEHSTATPELEILPSQYWQDIINECELNKYPFVVAILTRQKIKHRAQTQRLKTDHVVGFAWAVNYGDVHNAYRFTAEIDIRVHPEHLHEGIGKTLLDRMMFAMSPTYSCLWKDPVPFIEAKGSNVCNGIGRETKVITAAILFAQADDEELKWKTKWLLKYGFQISGTMSNMAYKFGTP